MVELSATHRPGWQKVFQTPTWPSRSGVTINPEVATGSSDAVTAQGLFAVVPLARYADSPTVQPALFEVSSSAATEAGWRHVLARFELKMLDGPT